MCLGEYQFDDCIQTSGTHCLYTADGTPGVEKRISRISECIPKEPLNGECSSQCVLWYQHGFCQRTRRSSGIIRLERCVLHHWPQRVTEATRRLVCCMRYPNQMDEGVCCRKYSNCDCQPIEIVDSQAQLCRYPMICVRTFIIRPIHKVHQWQHTASLSLESLTADDTQAYNYCKFFVLHW